MSRISTLAVSVFGAPLVKISRRSEVVPNRADSDAIDSEVKVGGRAIGSLDSGWGVGITEENSDGTCRLLCVVARDVSCEQAHRIADEVEPQLEGDEWVTVYNPIASIEEALRLYPDAAQ